MHFYQLMATEISSYSGIWLYSQFTIKKYSTYSKIIYPNYSSSNLGVENLLMITSFQWGLDQDCSVAAIEYDSPTCSITSE